MRPSKKRGSTDRANNEEPRVISHREEKADELPFSPAVGCLIALALGFAGAALFFQVIKLVSQGELRLGGPAIAPNRLWLVQERDAAGLFLATNRVVNGSLQADEVCLNTKVRSFLWRSQGDPQVEGYCLCYQRTEAGWRQSGACPEEVRP